MELTNKQRKFLRAQAVTLKPVLQIGKAGMSQDLLTNLRESLDAHELVKVSILQNSEVDTDDLAQAVEPMGITVVQAIGRVLIVFKVSDKPERRVLSEQVRQLW